MSHGTVTPDRRFEVAVDAGGVGGRAGVGQLRVSGEPTTKKRSF
jgi:hypothetical protein